MLPASSQLFFWSLLGLGLAKFGKVVQYTGTHWTDVVMLLWRYWIEVITAMPH